MLRRKIPSRGPPASARAPFYPRNAHAWRARVPGRVLQGGDQLRGFGPEGLQRCKTRFRPSCGVANAAYRRVAFHLLHTHLLLTASDALHSRTSELVTEDAVVLSCWGMSVPNGSCPLFRNRQGSCSYSETDECTKR
jgi:hypothetical protein